MIAAGSPSMRIVSRAIDALRSRTRLAVETRSQRKNGLESTERRVRLPADTETPGEPTIPESDAKPIEDAATDTDRSRASPMIEDNRHRTPQRQLTAPLDRGDPVTPVPLSRTHGYPVTRTLIRLARHHCQQEGRVRSVSTMICTNASKRTSVLMSRSAPPWIDSSVGGHSATSARCSPMIRCARCGTRSRPLSRRTVMRSAKAQRASNEDELQSVS